MDILVELEPGFLRRYFRDKVLEEAETQYVAA